MKVKTKKIWGAGLVSISTPYVLKALALKEGLEIECKGVTKSISYEKLAEKKPRKDSFTDGYGRQRDYSLYDFFWGDLK